MSWFKSSVEERIAVALERLVALQEHRMGLRPILPSLAADESAVSYHDRMKAWEEEQRRLGYIEEVGIEPPNEEAMYPSGIVPGRAVSERER